MKNSKFNFELKLQAGHCGYQSSGMIIASATSLQPGKPVLYWRTNSSKIIVHESYSPESPENDIALVKTLKPAPSNGELRKTKLLSRLIVDTICAIWYLSYHVLTHQIF